jgi:V/A-type H+-transporting ATPase subunit E
MALEDILVAIDAQVQAEQAQILEEAEAEADRIEAEARQDAEAIRERHFARLQHQADADRVRRVNEARLDARFKVMQAKEALLTAVFDEAARRLAQARTDSRYADALGRLIQEVIDELGEDVIIRLDSRDTALAAQCTIPATCTVDPSLECWGGIVAATLDNRLVVNNTLEARLEQAQALLRNDLTTLIWRSEP